MWRPGKHHTLVHRDTSSHVVASVVAASNIPLSNDPNPVVNIVAATTNSVSSDIPRAPNCLVMTSKVVVKGPDWRSMITRALLDSGASMSMLSNKVAQTLQLPRHATNITFSGAQATPLQVSQAITQVSLCLMHSHHPILSITAAIVPRVTCDLPLQGATHVRDMPHIRSLSMADPTFHLPGRVDLLLGCDIISEIMLRDRINGPKDAPMAVETVFGWAILGPHLPNSTNQTVNVVTPEGATPCDELLTHFWETEEPPTNHPIFTPEEESVQKAFFNDPCLHRSSRPLPSLTSEHVSLGLSRPQAVHRYISNRAPLRERAIMKRFSQ